MPLEKRQKEWIRILKRFNVPTLNRLLVQKGKQPRGDKTDKLLALSELPAHELQKLVTQESATSSDSNPKPEKSANEQDQKKQKAKGTGGLERAAKRAKQSSSSSSSYSSASSSDSEKEEAEEAKEEQGQESLGEEVGENEHSKDGDCANDPKSDPVTKWKLSGSNRKNWEMYLGYSAIFDLQNELAQTLVSMEPCTNDQAQISLRPILKRFTPAWQPVLLVSHLPEKEEVKVNHCKAIAADDRQKAEIEKDKKIEKEVDRFMHTLSERTEKRRADSTERSPAGKHQQLQESFDEDARKQAAKNGFVPGVLVFWKGQMHRAWRIESIRCDRGRDKAMVCDPEWGPVTQHREYKISELVLAEPSPGPVV